MISMANQSIGPNGFLAVVIERPGGHPRILRMWLLFAKLIYILHIQELDLLSLDFSAVLMVEYIKFTAGLVVVDIYSHLFHCLIV